MTTPSPAPSAGESQSPEAQIALVNAHLLLVASTRLSELARTLAEQAIQAGNASFEADWATEQAYRLPGVVTDLDSMLPESMRGTIKASRAAFEELLETTSAGYLKAAQTIADDPEMSFTDKMDWVADNIPEAVTKHLSEDIGLTNAERCMIFLMRASKNPVRILEKYDTNLQ
ncbi:hypothetical protein COY07_05780 [Candidatus Peregrinibacteria bacterium CG_4_10_14_0_2_um_filter_43_11]|nr:MAG: hypothetical protein COY07_05780 [Candidatus Peregrinibacteria bacterium CG_4_10_14_0_2_um_filter_43_11]